MGKFRFFAISIIVLLSSGVFAQGEEEPFRAQNVWTIELEQISAYTLFEPQWSPNNDYLLVANGKETYLVDALSGETLSVFSTITEPRRVRWNSRGSYFAIMELWDKPISIVEVPSGEITQLDTNPTTIYGISWHPSNPNLILLGGYDEDEDITGAIWNATTQAIVKDFDGDNGSYTVSNWSVKTNELYVPTTFGKVLVYDTETWGIERILSIYPETDILYEAIPNPALTRLLVTRSHPESSVTIVDIETSAEIASLSIEIESTYEYSLYPRGLGWSPDGRYVWVENASDGQVSIWDTTTYEEVLLLYSETPNEYGSLHRPQLTWSSDSQRVLVANGRNIEDNENYDNCSNSARIIDIATGATTHIMCGHSMTVGYAYWNNDESMVVTTSKDGTMRLWDLTQEAE